MTFFWLLAAGLALVAAGFVLAPLWLGRDSGAAPDHRDVHRDRLRELEAEQAAGRISAAEFTALRDELAAAVLDDARLADRAAVGVRRGGRLPVLVVAVLVPVAGIVGYQQAGQLDDVALANELAAVDRSAGAAGDAEHSGNLPDLIARLEQRLADDPDDAEGWFLLGRTAMELRQWRKAADAFAKAQALNGAEPAVQVLEAQALYLANDRRLDAAGRAAADAVLAADPNNPVVLQILAMEAFRSGDFQAVVDYIDRALPAVDDPEVRGYLEQGRKQALAAMADGAPTAVPAASMAAAPAGGAGLAVQVSAAPALLASHGPDSAVFVLARDPGRGPMPLAVRRLTLADLPTTVLLDDSTAMSPAMTLSSASTVEVVARLSLSGDARRGEGDVEARLGPVTVADQPTLQLVLGGSSAVSPAAAAPVAAPVAAAPAASGAVLNVLVELDPALAPVDPATPVFVFARTPSGPAMPVAVHRLTAGALPALVRLDDSSAMMPGRTLGAVGPVQLVARVALGGSANAAPGDLEGQAGPVDPAAQRAVVPLRINRRLP